MLKLLISLLLSLWFIYPSVQLLAQAGHSQELNSEIKRVTVFLSGAQIWRSAKTTLNSGKTELVLSGISPYLDENSIQVKSEKPNCSIMAVSSRKNYLKKKEQQATIEQLQQRQRELNEKIADGKGQQDIRAQTRAILAANRNVAGANVGLNTTELKNNVLYQESKLNELLQQELAWGQTLKKLDEELGKINRQLTELNAQVQSVSTDILVTLYASNSTEANLEITYRTNRASWYAAYDLRAKDIEQPIELEYRAFVQQQSGEDWRNVKLSLSTGNPAQDQVKPELDTWFLRYHNSPLQSNGSITIINNHITQVKGKVIDAKTSEAIVFATITTVGASVGTQTDFDGNYSLQIPAGVTALKVTYVGYKDKIAALTEAGTLRMEESSGTLEEINIASCKKPLLEREVEIPSEFSYDRNGNVINLPTRNVNAVAANTAGVYAKNEGIVASPNIAHQEQRYQTGVTYHIEQPYSVLADGKSQSVQIKTYQIPATYEYYCAPKLNNNAFLTALIPEWESLNLPDGEVNLFFEDTYVGKSLLNPQYTGDTLTVSLGIDKDIIVERNKQTELRNRQTVGSHKTDSRAYEIKVRNTKNKPIQLTIADQIPVSTDKDMEVKDTEWKDARHDETSGILKWQFELPAKQEKKLYFKYAVKYPKSKTLSLE
jgi:hypothetical protein